MTFENTLRHLVDQVIKELPPMTEQKRELLEQAEDPIAEKLIDLADLVETIPVDEQAEEFMPLIKRLFLEEAVYAEVTRFDDLDDEIREEAEDRRQRSGDWLNELELTVRTW